MRAIELTAPSLDALKSTTLPDPVAGPGEVVVRLRAASLNYLDLAVAGGHYPVPRFPLVPVADGAGEVAAIGRDVTSVKVGDRVIPHFMPGWHGGRITPANVSQMRGVTLPGSLAEFAAVDERGLVHLPDHLSFAEAATLPIVGTTAWRAMRAANIRPGSVVVLLGTGGVSLFALQLAKAFGATVILTSGSDEKLERARALGADHIINYRATPDWENEILKLTEGRGADLVIETVGGNNFVHSLKAAAYGGVVFTIGFVGGTSAAIDLMPIIAKGVTVQGNNTGPVEDLADVARAVATHRITPIIDKEFGINEAAAAYARLGGGQHFGKVAILH